MPRKAIREVAARPAVGGIRADELLLLSDAARRLKSAAVIRGEVRGSVGLKTTRFGRNDYVLGRDVLDFLASWRRSRLRIYHGRAECRAITADCGHH